jgi:DTW domain-containing protein YfiP
LISKVQNSIEVLILQHPMEVSQTKGTARLLHLCLPNSYINVGEVFEDALFLSSKNTILLYPITQEDYSLGIASPPNLDPSILIHLDNIRLIILDGTWRKSRKILIKNPYLQTLPRLVLEDLPAGQYTIRKARKPHQLSTFEATCAALAQLEGGKAKFEPLCQSFTAFNAFIAKQMQKNGVFSV